MRKLGFILGIIIFQNGAYADSTVVGQINEITASVRKMYAPDSRTAFFETVTDLENMSIRVETTESEAIEEFKRQIYLSKIQLQVYAFLLPLQGANERSYAIANLSVSNNRTAPGHSSELSTQMLLGTPVEVLKKTRGYYLVRTPDKYLSWVDQAGIMPMTKAEFEAWKSAKKVVYTADHGCSYLRRSKSAARVSDLVKGDILKVISKGWRYYKVAYPDNRTGFIPAKDLQDYNKWTDRADPTPQAILETAKTMIGVPYLWGGTSIKGVDCSGFTKTSYFLNGIILPRDASQQALVGQPVDILEGDSFSLKKGLVNLQPGDLLFFATRDDGKRKGKITHTALYMGNGEFIQAAGLVKISSLFPEASNYDPFHVQTLVGARRVLTAIGNPEIIRVEEHPWYNSITNTQLPNN